MMRRAILLLLLALAGCADLSEPRCHGDGLEISVTVPRECGDPTSDPWSVYGGITDVHGATIADLLETNAIYAQGVFDRIEVQWAWPDGVTADDSFYFSVNVGNHNPMAQASGAGKITAQGCQLQRATAKCYSTVDAGF